MAQSVTPKDVSVWRKAVDTALSTTAWEDIFGGPVEVGAIFWVNSAAAVASIKIYDSDGDGLTPGTTAPTHVIPVVASDTDMVYFSPPLKFTNGLSLSASKNAGLLHTNAPDASLRVTVIARNI